jgi:hypothetical protein
MTNDKIISINGIDYIPVSETNNEMAINTDGLPYVIIRTYSAGVHAGYLKKREGREVTLVNTRRIYYWSGACSLSQMALQGVKHPEGCKFTVVLPEILLLEAIEVIPCTIAAKLNIEGVPVWKS